MLNINYLFLINLKINLFLHYLTYKNRINKLFQKIFHFSVDTAIFNVCEKLRKK